MTRFRFMTVLLLLAACCLAPACSPSPDPTSGDGKVRVAVSVAPQAFVVDRIGGDRVETQVLVEPGSAPETYDPTPRQMMTLAAARLYVKVGHPDFPFEKKHLSRLLAGRQGLTVVDMAGGLTFLPAVPDPSGEHVHAGETDPHIWLSPPVMERAARRIAMALGSLDPGHADAFNNRLEAFLRDLEQLDAELKTTLAAFESRQFLVQHPAWGYFAEHYGLRQKAIESGGREPGALALVTLIEEARRDGVRVVFVQHGISDRAARVIAREIGAEVVVLDPLAYDWMDNLRQVAAAFRQALGG